MSGGKLERRTWLLLSFPEKGNVFQAEVQNMKFLRKKDFQRSSIRSQDRHLWYMGHQE
jgi:hypothetical protein